MTELNIENELEKNSIVVNKNNSIIYDKMINVLNFYKNFDEVINNKNENIDMHFDNKKVNSKDYILINLIDIDNILNSIKYQKGTILYEYITTIIDNCDFELNQEINEYLENKIINISKKFCFESKISFESDLNKIFSTGIQIKSKISLENLNIKINEILNDIIMKKQNKTFIIFYNSEFINFQSNYDNLYLFDISQKNDFQKYNVICLNSLENFNQELLLDKIKLNWPIEYKEHEIENLLNKFLLEYFKDSEIISDDKNILILSKLLNKFYNLDKSITIENSKIDPIIKSFLSKF